MSDEQYLSDAKYPAGAVMLLDRYGLGDMISQQVRLAIHGTDPHWTCRDEFIEMKQQNQLPQAEPMLVWMVAFRKIPVVNVVRALLNFAAGALARLPALGPTAAREVKAWARYKRYCTKWSMRFRAHATLHDVSRFRVGYLRRLRFVLKTGEGAYEVLSYADADLLLLACEGVLTAEEEAREGARS